MAISDQTPWGRVDENGTVYVRENNGEREVGQYPDASVEEALAYFERKYSDLAGQVALFEQRLASNTPASQLLESVKKLQKLAERPNVIGNIASLQERIETLAASLEKRHHEQTLENEQALKEIRALREQLITEAEALAGQPEKSIQWKQTTAAFEELFTRWKETQKTHASLPTKEADQLWKRFRSARTLFENKRRAYFAELDAHQRIVRVQKAEIIEKAEALAPLGAEGIPQYRDLLNEWKKLGRSSKKSDDALWDQLKKAGDVLYAAKADLELKENAIYEENLTAKRALLEEYANISTEEDRIIARKRLRELQEKWEKIGHVPRHYVRELEDQIRSFEQTLNKREKAHWESSDPAKKARSEGLAKQLLEAIEALEQDLVSAQKKNDQKAIAEIAEALTARKAWLGAFDNSSQ